MKIIVLVKAVPDTETRIQIGPDGASLNDTDIKWIPSPFDEYALEEALKIVETKGDGEVTVVCLGDDRAQPVIRQCLAMGAHRGVLLSDEAMQGGDGLATARALAAACKKSGFDLILCGKQGFGQDRSQVGVMVAELLDIPSVSVVTGVELGDVTATCQRNIEGGTEIVETSLPALLTAEKGLNEPRYAKLKGIMAAKKKPIDIWSVSDLDLSPSDVGKAGSLVQWTTLELPSPRASGTILTGDATEAAAELVRLLADEAKVI